MSVVYNEIAGISGGRTSARMAYLLDETVTLCFQNTGREHSKTYEFIARLEDDLKRPIVRLEYRAPSRGEAPGKSTFEIVEHRHLARRGEPFRDLLECLKSYRATKKKPAIAPWARQRLCTAYLKIKTQTKFAASLGWEDWTSYVGLRADEPERVALMKKRCNDRDSNERAPLFDLGVTKQDVLAFWSRKDFDLDLPEYLGNCTGCFLKDERDLADALMVSETEAAWWIAIERDFAPMRRGGRPSYAEVFAEAPYRLEIRRQLAMGHERIASTLPERRVSLIVRQEQKPRESFSCSCESAEFIDDDFVAGVA